MKGYKDPLIFNFKVAGSLLRQVYQAEKLAFPTSLNTWARAYAEIYGKASHGAWWKETLKNGTWAGVGVAVSRSVFGRYLADLFWLFYFTPDHSYTCDCLFHLSHSLSIARRHPYRRSRHTESSRSVRSSDDETSSATT